MLQLPSQLNPCWTCSSLFISVLHRRSKLNVLLYMGSISNELMGITTWPADDSLDKAAQYAIGFHCSVFLFANNDLAAHQEPPGFSAELLSSLLAPGLYSSVSAEQCARTGNIMRLLPAYSSHMFRAFRMEGLLQSSISTAPLPHTQFAIIHELAGSACCPFMLMKMFSSICPSTDCWLRSLVLCQFYSKPLITPFWANSPSFHPLPDPCLTTSATKTMSEALSRSKTSTGIPSTTEPSFHSGR